MPIAHSWRKGRLASFPQSAVDAQTSKQLRAYTYPRAFLLAHVFGDVERPPRYAAAAALVAASRFACVAFHDGFGQAPAQHVGTCTSVCELTVLKTCARQTSALHRCCGSALRRVQPAADRPSLKQRTRRLPFGWEAARPQIFTRRRREAHLAPQLLKLGRAAPAQLEQRLLLVGSLRVPYL